MERRLALLLVWLLLGAGAARAQWVVSDPSNLAQGIVNSTNEMVHTSSTAQSMLQNFQQTVKIYEQNKKYYDALRKVNKLVRDARKVQRCMLLVGEISDIYVDGYRRIVTDTNFSVEELAAIAIGYKRIIEEAAGELKDLGEIINPTDMSLTDKDRIDVVERVYGTLMRHRRLAGYFTRRCISVSLLRARTHRDMERVVALYGTDEQRYWMVHMLLSMDNMHGILRQLYTDMMTLCEGMTSVASGIAGLGALLYISYRVWQSLARGEAIDLFPLLRPFALGICIMFFPTLVLGSLNGILSPVVQATHSLMVGQTFNIEHYMEQREALEREERERLPADSYYAEDPEMERELDALGLDEQTRSTLDKMDEERSSWSFKGWLMKGLAYILELAFAAAAIVVDALRTFYLVVLSILGPLAFAIAVFDGFQSSLTNWLSKYVSIYLWLPISDLFSAIIARLQVLSLQQETTGGTAVTLIFMVIGICGYMCIPSISTWIVQTGGISSFNHAVARTTKLVTGLMGMAAGKGYAGGKAAWHGVRWVTGKLRRTRQ